MTDVMLYDTDELRSKVLKKVHEEIKKKYDGLLPIEGKNKIAGESPRIACVSGLRS